MTSRFLNPTPHAAPPGVLPGHPEDQCCGLRVDRRPARLTRFLEGPLASDQRAVPAPQRLWCYQKRCPPIPGQESAGGREQDPVACGELGAAGLAAQHPKLMPQNKDLQVLGAVIAVRKDQQTGQHANGQPEHEEHRGMVGNACSRRESGFPRPTGLRWPNSHPVPGLATPLSPTRPRNPAKRGNRSKTDREQQQPSSSHRPRILICFLRVPPDRKSMERLTLAVVAHSPGALAPSGPAARHRSG